MINRQDTELNFTETINLRHDAKPEPLQESRSLGQGNIILFHGLTGTPAEVKELAEFLFNQGFDVFAPRLSGHGVSIQELKMVSAEKWFSEAESFYSQIAADNDNPLYLLGLSFGSLLAMYLAVRHPNRIKGLVLLSVPFRLRSLRKEFFLSALSYLPDWILNHLWLVKKSNLDSRRLAKVREAYKQHSIAALARMLYMRRKVKQIVNHIKCPVIVLHDPEDYHLSHLVPQMVSNAIGPDKVEIVLFPGGEHKLTIGHRYQEVFAVVYNFYKNINQKLAVKLG